MPHIVALSVAGAKRRRSGRRSHESRRFTAALTSKFEAASSQLREQVPGPDGHIIAVALIRDLGRAAHAAELSTQEHRLLREMYFSQGISLSFLLWSSVVDVARLLVPIEHQISHGYVQGHLKAHEK